MGMPTNLLVSINRDTLLRESLTTLLLSVNRVTLLIGTPTNFLVSSKLATGTPFS